MQSPSSEGPVREASWRWDGEADGVAQAPEDVVGGGGDGPRLSRRGLLAGAGVLAAGGAVWAFGRSGADQPAPPPKPQPTPLSGPTPVWTYRGPEAMTPERLAGRTTGPVFLSRAGLQVVDPATGAAARLLTFEAPSRDWPSDLELLPKVVLGPDRMFTTTSPGHLDSRHLSDPAADWSLPLPDDLQGSLHLAGCDDDTLYGYAWSPGWEKSATVKNRIFAIRISDRSVLWNLPTDRDEQPVGPVTAPGGRIPYVRNLGGRAELVVRDAADGRELWKATAEDLRWCICGPANVYVPEGAGVRALRPTGEPAWTVSPARDESWRAMPPVPDGPRIYLPRDNGLVTGHDAATGALQWSYRLPFLLDSRSHPLVVGGTLFVPGPAAAGVCAIDTANGRPRWTFRDSGPGKDVWSLAADAGHLYAGHDDVLHALPLT
ncbi:outer membrane protein assembly factor BamB [Kitasatospora sp. MAA19]|uniref:outer membrane protein assembly factor BamB family protein n=1 Tax=unclassified Kitasatospora TaxID=2633591 RepID=UPI0024750B8E|nr:PQQ-binding-like beta-propeller repeat protein [Kitasatospora sp. MAA19]MDH6707898.1 outer membrane protein assembly factor BamB [Kitasatospora sp. MAA19]